MKKHHLLVVGSCAALALNVACDRKPKLDNDKAKVSYAIGQNIAANIKAQNVELDPKVVGYSVAQGLKGEKPEISAEDQQKALQALQAQVQQKAMADAQKGQAMSLEFLNANKDKPNIKTSKTGLQYEVLKQGSGRKPSLKDKVKVHYTGTLITGQKFDSSHDRNQPAEFPVGGIIKGWQEALQMMPVGSVYRLWVPPDLGYGAQGQPGIPPFSVLVFDVELLDIVK